MLNTPLSGIRIADLTNVIAGPVATRVLAHLGAEVVKVELPWGRAIGNIAMHGDTGSDRPYDVVTSFNEVNRSKKSIAIDLTHSDGKEIFKEIVSISDIVIQNYSPRVMSNLGLTYDILRTIRPDLIMVSMPALGLEGPWSDYISFGPGTDALGGLSSITGYKGDRPHKPGNFYADHNSAFHVATGIMSSILKRQTNGFGEHLEIVLREATMSVIGEYFLEFQLTGTEPERTGNDHHKYYPHGIYKCKGIDSWLAITIENNREWIELCSTIGAKDFIQNPKLNDIDNRRNARISIDHKIEEWTSSITNKEAMTLLQSAGVKAGIVSKASDLISDPQFYERNYLDEVTHPDAGPSMSPGLPFKFSNLDTNLGNRAPLYSEHTEHILNNLLGLDRSFVQKAIHQGTTPLKPLDRIYQ